MGSNPTATASKSRPAGPQRPDRAFVRLRSGVPGMADRSVACGQIIEVPPEDEYRRNGEHYCQNDKFHRV